MQRLVSLRLAVATAAVVVGTTVWNEDADAQRRGGRSGGARSGGGRSSGGRSGGFSRGGGSRSSGSRGFSRSGGSRSSSSRGFSRGSSGRSFSRGSSGRSISRGSSSIGRGSSSGFRRSSGSGISRGSSSGIRRGTGGSISRGSIGRGSIGSGPRSGGINLGSRGSIGRGGSSDRRSSGINLGGRRSGGISIGGRSGGIRGRSGSWNFNIGRSGLRGGIGGRSGISNFSRGSSRRINIGGGGRNRFSSRWLASGGRGGFGGRGGIGGRGGFGGRGFRGGLRNSWGFWLSRGYGGWGLGFGLGYGGFGYGGFGFGPWGYPGVGYFNYPYTIPVGGYYNPYCDVTNDYFPGETVVYDYSQPVTGSTSPNDAGVTAIAAADEAFRAGDYKLALAEVDKAVKAMPQNSDAHQLRSLVLFALRDYRNAASAAHAALMGGPGWNWETLRSFYPSVDAYTVHLRALEAHRSGNLTATDARFLLAYHYMMMGHADAAAEELVVVINNQPKDKLAVALLNAISKETGKKYKLQSAPSLVPPLPPTPPTPKARLPLAAPRPPLDRAGLAAWKGTWKATQPNGTVITLQLLDGGKFRWSATSGGNTTTVSGTFTMQKDQLNLSGSRAGQLLQGTMTPSGNDEFGLKLKYQPADEPALAFKRQ